MIKTEKEAQAKTKAKAKGRFKMVRRAKPKFKTYSLNEPLSLSEAYPVAMSDRLARLQSPTGQGTSRLEARIPTSIYEVMERAAALRGLTLTAYVTATMGEDARRTIEQDAVVRLSRADQIAFAEALINPPMPSAKLVAAAKRHAPMTRK